MASNDLIPQPVHRKLRIFASDPSLAAQYKSSEISDIIITVPWEKDLRPGPVGEYIEVVDADPASGCFYEPIDLNDPRILAQNGLVPSETNPQFHQQMVYAVAMATIGHFEQALGRVALWSARRENTPDGSFLSEQFVRRLRIYPHALRDRNAYYSPSKKALLFGYFPAGIDDHSNTRDTIIFNALSHDIIAHETTHALLDGVHPRFNEPVNCDVLAFHEAFADIVALFQHFSYPGVLRHQIAQTRGDLSQENLLAQLAQQFGAAAGRGGALRDALGGRNRQTGKWEPHTPNVQELQNIREPHGRGAILVAAVFGAFLKVYHARTIDLFRIASEGTGVLRQGDIHPDLANRLADEAARCAQYILQMCISGHRLLPASGHYLWRLSSRHRVDPGSTDKVRRIDDFLAFERGGEEEDFSAATAVNLLRAAAGAERSQNKRAMSLFKRLSNGNVKYLRPHEKACKIARAEGVRVFPLGPPRDASLLQSLDPEGDEEFRLGAFSSTPTARYFAATVGTLEEPGRQQSPFARRYRVAWNDALSPHAKNSFWQVLYGSAGAAPIASTNPSRSPDEAEDNPEWRRIDNDWLYSAENLALDMNEDTNNGSLVLAFELAPGGKVLLFTADAQRGNWMSWTKGTWKDGEREVSVRDLLGRTVLYKVGHHGSHNATLKRGDADDVASLEWMGIDGSACEFTAMITAVRAWAETKKGWDHPLKAIKDALLSKAGGRVIQTDTDVHTMTPQGPGAEWEAFQARVRGTHLFVDYTIRV